MGAESIDQRRAKHAWNAIQDIKKDKQEGKKYGSQAKKLPMRIMAAGLGPALAFLDAKGYAPQLITDLSGWVNKRIKGEGKLLERIIEGDSDFLRRATDETLAYLQWLTRFAEAEGLLPNDGE